MDIKWISQISLRAQTQTKVFCKSFFILLFLCSPAQSQWVSKAFWEESAAYKECSGIIFSECWHDVNIYTNVNSVELGDLVVVYNSRSRKEIARFNVQGIYYEISSNRCWISAKTGSTPDTYLTALGCRE